MKEPNLITTLPRQCQPGEVLLMGAPWDRGSSHLRGSALAPARIREALFSSARNLVTESGLDLTGVDRCHCLGDLDLERAGTLDLLETTASQVVAAGACLLSLGGDHSISPAAIAPVARKFPGLNVVQIDAHPDLYEEYDGDRQSHACPMSRILEQSSIGRLIQIGIRARTPEQKDRARGFGVEVLGPAEWHAEALAKLDLDGPVYVTFDLDGLDPAFAPGVSHPEPGGLSSRQAVDIVQALPTPIVGADIVELNPLLDSRDRTAVVAAKITKELLARMLEEAGK